MILNKANQNRLEILEENTWIRNIVDNTSKAIHETRESSQVLEETTKIRDMEINAMEDIVKQLREGCAKRIKEEDVQ